MDTDKIPDIPENFKRMALPTEFDVNSVKRKFLDVSYGNLEEQTLDIFLPDEGEGPFPIIIYIHGGGWIMGTKRMGALDCIKDCIKHGYALATVDYRLAPNTKFPGFLFDVKTAIRFLRANAEKYNLDSKHIALIGDSAGGHLSLMAAVSVGHPEYEGEEYGWAGISGSISAAVDMYGPAVLDADWNEMLKENGISPMQTGGNNNEPSFLEMSFTTDKNMLKLVSPISYVNKDMPPVLIQHGGVDPVVPVQNSILVAEKIDRICGKGRCDLRIYPERSHSDKDFMTEENCLEVLSFLDKYMK